MQGLLPITVSVVQDIVLRYLGYPDEDNYRLTRLYMDDNTNDNTSKDGNTSTDGIVRIGLPLASSLYVLHAVYTIKKWSEPLASRLQHTLFAKCFDIYSVEIGRLSVSECNDDIKDIDCYYQPWHPNYLKPIPPTKETHRQDSGRSCASCDRRFSNRYVYRGYDSVWFVCQKNGCRSTTWDYWYTDPYYSCTDRLTPGGPCCNYDLCQTCYTDKPHLHENGCVHRMTLLSHTFCKGGRYCKPNMANFPSNRNHITPTTTTATTTEKTLLKAETKDEKKQEDDVQMVPNWRLFMRSDTTHLFENRPGTIEWYVDCAPHSPTAWRVVQNERYGTNSTLVQFFYLFGSIESFIRHFPEKLRSLSVFALNM